MQFLIVLCFILLDIITGIISAIRNKKWSSTKMREGGFHKMAIIFFIVLAVLCDYGQHFINIGFNLPITKGVLVYVCLMEIGSIAENIGNTYPYLKKKLTTTFKGGE